MATTYKHPDLAKFRTHYAAQGLSQISASQGLSQISALQREQQKGSCIGPSIPNRPKTNVDQDGTHMTTIQREKDPLGLHRVPPDLILNKGPTWKTWGPRGATWR